jgi:radical SAM superfamily enzyme YgiQ (UPF0313 family)
MKNQKFRIKESAAGPLRIYLTDLVHDYLQGNYTIPYNIGLLAAYLEHNFGSSVEIRLFKSTSCFLDAIKTGKAPHIVGFSNYLWNARLNHHMMKKVKQHIPDAVLCMGGPLIRTDTSGISDFLRKYDVVDYYAMYEGEMPLGNLVEYFLSKGKVIKKEACDTPINGVAYLSNNELVFPKLEFKKEVIENIPSPYLTGWLDEWVYSPQWVPMLETNRGCPYPCTFCTWGISTLNNVRKFPLERVLEEVRYIAKRSPSPRWVIVDANFGMLGRDIDIAREIRRVADEFGTLKSTLLFWAKNSTQRTLEISRILDLLIDPKIAVQSLDQDVLKAIKRDNIKISSMTDLLSEYFSGQRKVGTDVLAGLSGQSYESFLNTVRETFDMGYDYVDTASIILCPGSEMDSDECRATYELKSKYRLMTTSYGVYDGDVVVDCEEGVRSSRDISENEMLMIRSINFFIVAFWNLGMAKPLLKWLHQEKGVNPLDVFLTLTKSGLNPAFDDFLKKLMTEARNEWFDTEEELVEHYTNNFNRLSEEGFLKINLKYTAILLLDRDLTKGFLDTIAEHCCTGLSPELTQFCMDGIYFMDTRENFKVRNYSDSLVASLKKSYPSLPISGNKCHFKLQDGNEEAISFELKKYGFDKNPVQGLSQALEGPYRSKFLLDFKFVEEEGDYSRTNLSTCSEVE